MSLRKCLFLGLIGLASACEGTEKSTGQSRLATTLESAEMAVAGAGGVQDLVARARAAALKDGRRLVVYVGATWCQPCEYFLQALEAKQLPAHLADLRFLKFDNDRDEARLDAAGYGGQMIPRFVLPAKDGSATEFRFEGSIKGPEAVANIVPRLDQILAGL